MRTVLKVGAAHNVSRARRCARARRQLARASRKRRSGRRSTRFFAPGGGQPGCGVNQVAASSVAASSVVIADRDETIPAPLILSRQVCAGNFGKVATEHTAGKVAVVGSGHVQLSDKRLTSRSWNASRDRSERNLRGARSDPLE